MGGHFGPWTVVHGWQVKEEPTRMGETWSEPLAADVVALSVNPGDVEWDCRGLVPKSLCGC